VIFNRLIDCWVPEQPSNYKSAICIFQHESVIIWPKFVFLFVLLLFYVSNSSVSGPYSYRVIILFNVTCLHTSNMWHKWVGELNICNKFMGGCKCYATSCFLEFVKLVDSILTILYWYMYILKSKSIELWLSTNM